MLLALGISFNWFISWTAQPQPATTASTGHHYYLCTISCVVAPTPSTPLWSSSPGSWSEARVLQHVGHDVGFAPHHEVVHVPVQHTSRLTIPVSVPSNIIRHGLLIQLSKLCSIPDCVKALFHTHTLRWSSRAMVTSEFTHSDSEIQKEKISQLRSYAAYNCL